jgi:uncharacterized membrane protein YbhN (UPF0104 family)
MGKLLRRPLVLLAIGATIFGIVALASPGLLGDRLREALAGVREADARWLWVAALALAAMHACGGLAWSAALRACGSGHGHADAVARYGVGSGVGVLAPAHFGTATRVALLGRIVEGPGHLWRVGGAIAAASAVRTFWLAVLVAVAVAQGVLPLWPLLLLGAGVVVAVVAAIASRRIDFSSRVGHVLDAFRELTRSPRSLGAVVSFTCLSLVTKTLAAAAVATALGIDNPLQAALLIVPALEMAGVLPLTPGNAGIASAAVAFALHTQGTPTSVATAVGVAYGAVEMLTALGVGALGGVTLAAPRLRLHGRPVAIATASAVLAFALGGALVA